jgi:hypothetical protein
VLSPAAITTFRSARCVRIIYSGRVGPVMDRQKIIAVFFAFLMAMWMIATAATLL